MRRLQPRPFWITTLLLLAMFVAASSIAAGLIIAAATLTLFDVDWRTPVILAVCALAPAVVSAAAGYPGAADVATIFVIELMTMAVAMLALTERKRRR